MNSYEKTQWMNGQAPALNAENLNKIEQGIYDAIEKIIEFDTGKLNVQYAHESHSAGYDAETNPVDEYDDGGVFIDDATDAKTIYIVKAANAYNTPYGTLIPATANNLPSNGFAQLMITSTGRFWFRYKDSETRGGAWHPSSGWTSLLDGKLEVKEAVANTSTPGAGQVKLDDAVEPNTIYKYVPTGGHILPVVRSSVQCQYYFAEDGVMRSRVRGKQNDEWEQWPAQFETYVTETRINRYLSPQNRGDKYFLRTCINKAKITINKDTQILAFGDSIISTSDGGSWLTSLKDEVGCPTPYNLAVSGASFGVNAYSTSAKLMSAQLTTLSAKVASHEIDLENIDLIIVAAGTNDAFNDTPISGTTESAFTQAVSRFIMDLQAKFLHADVDCPPILFITPIRRGSFSSINANGEDNVEIKLAKYGAVICNVALSFGCSVINGFDIPIITDNITVNDVNNNSATLQSFMLPNDAQHLHPNSTEGARTYAYAVLSLVGSTSQTDAYTKAETNELLEDKMDLAPLNPTADEIAAMSSGQIYDEASDGVVTIKGGTELLSVLTNGVNPEYGTTKGRVGQISYYDGKFYQCFGRNEQDTAYVWKLMNFAGDDVIRARSTSTGVSGDLIISSSTTLHEIWKLFTRYHCVKVALTNQYGNPTGAVCWITSVTGANHQFLSAFVLPTGSSATPVYQKIHFLEQNGDSSSDTLRLVTKYVYPPYESYYTADEIDTMIGDIETLLAQI